MKEEIEMEKLIELLNQFEDTDNWENWYQVKFRESKIISKKFWFIKRLVENDKIDRERINDRWGDMSVHFTDEELFIMSLSISNAPIEDLISYLK